MDREIGSRAFPLWLLGDSNPEHWHQRLTSPLDPRHPIRHNIWTSVLDVIQDKVYREYRLRVNTDDIYKRNAVEDSNIKPGGSSLSWSNNLEVELLNLKSLIKENQPRIILSFGAFSYELGRRAIAEKPARYYDYWGAEELGNEFRDHVSIFNLSKINLLPLLHRSVAGGYFLSAHRDFYQKEGENYFNYVGEKIAEQILKYRLELPIWIK